METDAAFLLRVLQDGKPHSLNEILQRSLAERGCGITVHSRAADCRKQGHTIVHANVPGAKRGAGSTYRLVKPEPPKERCPESSQEGARCIYDEGHDGSHFAKDAFAYYSWDRKPEPVLACVVDESAGVSEQLALTRAEEHIFRDMANTPYA